jgi:hypothetical protein
MVDYEVITNHQFVATATAPSPLLPSPSRPTLPRKRRCVPLTLPLFLPPLAGGDPVETVDYEVIANGQVLATATAPPGATVSLQVPSPRLWSPASPALYDLRVTAGADTVLGYFGMRSFSVGHESGAGAEGVVRPLLNGEPIFLAGWLDQVRSAAYLDKGELKPTEEERTPTPICPHALPKKYRRI